MLSYLQIENALLLFYLYSSSFSCLVVVARSSGPVFIRSGEIGLPYFVPDHLGKACSLSPQNDFSTGFFINALFYFLIEVVSLRVLFLVSKKFQRLWLSHIPKPV